MVELLYYAAVAAAMTAALADWRRGLYLALFFEALRDPVRKIADGHSVLVTIAAGLVWATVFLGASRKLGPRLFLVLRQLPSLRNAITCLFVALAPAVLVSSISYSGGYRVAIVGFASYTLPLLGMAVGYHLPRRPEDVWRMLRFYCVVNAVVLSGTFFEFYKFDLPGLGSVPDANGNVFRWLRYEPGYIVDLMCGFYRSPDVMGLHAANVSMFASLLSLRPQARFRWLWIGLAVFGGFCLMLSGRRKMIGMVVVYGAIYASLRLRQTGATRVVPIMVALVALVAVVFAVMSDSESTSDYAIYAQSTFTQGGSRIQDNVIVGVLDSLQQTGILGIGLGTATQGRYYAEVDVTAKTWQEDGVSRIFAEMGLFGAVFSAAAVFYFLRGSYVAYKMVPPTSPVRELQIGMIGVVLATGASFVISHQAFSGDPCALLFVSLLFGIMLSGPTQVIRQMVAAEERQALLAEELAGPPFPN